MRICCIRLGVQVPQRHLGFFETLCHLLAYDAGGLEKGRSYWTPLVESGFLHGEECRTSNVFLGMDFLQQLGRSGCWTKK